MTIQSHGCLHKSIPQRMEQSQYSTNNNTSIVHSIYQTAESTPKTKVHDDQFLGTKPFATSHTRIANIATINKIHTIIRDEQIPRRPLQTISPIDLANYDGNNQ